MCSLRPSVHRPVSGSTHRGDVAGVVNDFAELFANYPAITRVYFNGAKAEALFDKLVKRDGRNQYQRLPSTSPAHALRPGEKLAAWRVICQL